MKMYSDGNKKKYERYKLYKQGRNTKNNLLGNLAENDLKLTNTRHCNRNPYQSET